MTTNRFGASPVITGNYVSLDVAVAANDTVWPNTVTTPITLTDDSPDQFLIDTNAIATVVSLPAPSAQNEGKNFFIKMAATSVGTLTVNAPAQGTLAPLVLIRVLDIALDFIQLECQDQTPVGGPVAYGWATVLCVDNGAWVA